MLLMQFKADAAVDPVRRAAISTDELQRHHRRNSMRHHHHSRHFASTTRASKTCYRLTQGF